jgi:flagellar FliL protein
MKKILGKKAIIAAGAITLLLAAGFFVLPRFISAPLQITVGVAGASGMAGEPFPPSSTPTPEGRPVGLMYTTKERVVNLADAGGYRYLKIQVVLEFALPEKEAKSLKGAAYTKKQEEFTNEMSARRGPIIEDIIGTVTGSKTAAAISTTEGKDNLKQELIKRLNEVTGEDHVTNVYFTQFLVQ